MADTAAVPGPIEDDAALEDMLDLSKKKKKKKPTKAFDDEPAAPTESAAAPSSVDGVAKTMSTSLSIKDDVSSPFNYDGMLSDLYTLLHEKNPELTDRHRKKIRPPEVMRVGSTRTAWINFKDNCISMKREKDHVLSFFLAELGTTGSIDGSERFLMRGRYLPKAIENLLRRYIQEYVTCHMCKSLETELARDAVSRLYFLSCKACGSQRSVAPIKAGFHATSKGDRKKAREAAS